MTEVTFIYNTLPTVIQCKKTDIFKNICQKFATKESGAKFKRYLFYIRRQNNRY